MSMGQSQAMDKYKAKGKVLAKYKVVHRHKDLVASYQAKRKVKFQPPMP